MCDNYNNYWWQNNFYHQYMQQHAAMMQWIQNLHSNVDMPSLHNVSHPCQCNTYYPKPVHCDNKPTEYNNPSNESSSCSSLSSSSGPCSTTDSGIKERESLETPEDDEDEEESDFELELNVDAILAMRKAKEELKKDESCSESSSIVMIDNVKEEFEFVELGSIREMESKRAVLAGGIRDRQAELQYEKEFKEHLYGEKFTTIAGLETAMSLTYERLCDIHQPPIWPVYPLRLSSRV